MSLHDKIQAEITAIETYLLAYLPVDHHDQIRRAVAVAGANVATHVADLPEDAHALVTASDNGSVATQTGTADPAEPIPVQGELDMPGITDEPQHPSSTP